MFEKIIKSSLQEIKNGFTYGAETQTYTCLQCGKAFEAGEIYQFDGRFFEAGRAAKHHIAKEHESLLKVLASFDKKYTGLSESQREILLMLYEGLTDNEIACKTGVAASTVRHQRFVLREKAKQAKLYLAIFELVEEAVSRKKENNKKEDLTEIHEGAKMVDERYTITKDDEEKIISSMFLSTEPLRLKIFSSKEKNKIVILREIIKQFNKGIKYSEKEVNSVLKPIYADFATIRRYLIEYGFMERTTDCREYWVK